MNSEYQTPNSDPHISLLGKLISSVSHYLLAHLSHGLKMSFCDHPISSNATIRFKHLLNYWMEFHQTSLVRSLGVPFQRFQFHAEFW